MKGEGRRITLRLTPAEFDRVNLSSQRAGLSLQTWCLEALLAAAAAAPAAPVPAQAAAQ